MNVENMVTHVHNQNPKRAMCDELPEWVRPPKPSPRRKARL